MAKINKQQTNKQKKNNHSDNVGKDVGKQEPRSLLVEVEDGDAIIEISVDYSQLANSESKI